MSEGRNTARRNRFRRIIKRRGDMCAGCGEPIDYDAHHLHPLSFQIDHIHPLAKGGSDTLDNIQAMHRKCNRDKGDDLPEHLLIDAPAGVTFVTARTWRP